jgi:predicted Na+-dependent transporter
MQSSTATNVRRALKVACVVGPTLAIINQTPAVVALLGGGAIPLKTAGRIALTFLVPFAVSLYSSTMADRRANRR